MHKWDAEGVWGNRTGVLTKEEFVSADQHGCPRVQAIHVIQEVNETQRDRTQQK